MKKKDFDDIIKKNEKDIKKDSFGYRVSNSSRIYENYYKKQVFDSFIQEMKTSYPDAFQSFYSGKGSELKEKKGRYGIMPPKMASVASSSRFCYLALKDGADALGGTGDVSFEYACRINGISEIAPQLDAYIKNENIYVEAKCHEIFDSHKITMKKKYFDLLCGTDNQFGLTGLPLSNKETFDIPLWIFGVNKVYSMFDIKQFLCHLLGIASQTGESKKLIYLFFKPDTEDEMHAEIENVFSELVYHFPIS